MDRNKLIRAHFEAYGELVWVTNLEPKFSQYNMDAAEIKEYREAFKWHAHDRDWDWWQEKVKGMSDAELQRDIAKCRTEIDQWKEEKARKGLQAFLKGEFVAENQPKEQSKDNERER